MIVRRPTIAIDEPKDNRKVVEVVVPHTRKGSRRVPEVVDRRGSEVPLGHRDASALSQEWGPELLVEWLVLS